MRFAHVLTAVLLAAILVGAPHGFAKSQVIGPNPIPEQIKTGPIKVALEDVVRLPASMEAPPSKPHFLAPALDGSGRLFVADQYSRLFVILRDGRLRGWPAIDMYLLLKPHFTSGIPEGGFSGFAIHPDAARAGRRGYAILYTVHTERAGSPVWDKGAKVFKSPSGKVHHVSVLTEWRFNSPAFHETSLARRRELMRFEQPDRDHEVGQIAFNPTAKPGDADYGTLYVGVGDGGNPQGIYEGQPLVDPFRVAQRLDSPFGKILRIRPTPRQRTRYIVPGDNPFIRRPAALSEIWAYGLRNPQRFSWDLKTGRMYIVDIGERHIEEVNIGRKGANYGWSLRQGWFQSPIERKHSKTLLTLPADDKKYGFTYPIAAYDHDEGYAIGGGYVYRGKAIPALVGMYVFTDIPTGRLFYFDTRNLGQGGRAEIFELQVMYKGRARSMMEIVGNLDRVDARLGQDADGEFFLLTKQDGMVRRLSPVQ